MKTDPSPEPWTVFDRVMIVLMFPVMTWVLWVPGVIGALLLGPAGIGSFMISSLVLTAIWIPLSWLLGSLVDDTPSPEAAPASHGNHGHPPHDGGDDDGDDDGGLLGWLV